MAISTLSNVFKACIFRYDHQYEPADLKDEVTMTNLRAKAVSQQVNRILSANLSPDYNHLLEAQLDVDPRVEAFWVFGGYEVPRDVAKSRKGFKHMKEYVNDPIDQCIKYTGKPMIHLRHRLPLREIVSLKEAEDVGLEVPIEPLDPRKMGYFPELVRATIIPGFWPGDHHEFGILSYLSSAHLAGRSETFNDNTDAAAAQAVLGSFSWLYSQACYQGIERFLSYSLFYF